MRQFIKAIATVFVCCISIAASTIPVGATPQDTAELNKATSALGQLQDILSQEDNFSEADFFAQFSSRAKSVNQQFAAAEKGLRATTEKGEARDGLLMTADALHEMQPKLEEWRAAADTGDSFAFGKANYEFLPLIDRYNKGINTYNSARPKPFLTAPILAGVIIALLSVMGGARVLRAMRQPKHQRKATITVQQLLLVGLGYACAIAGFFVSNGLVLVGFIMGLTLFLIEKDKKRPKAASDYMLACMGLIILSVIGLAIGIVGMLVR